MCHTSGRFFCYQLIPKKVGCSTQAIHVYMLSTDSHHLLNIRDIDANGKVHTHTHTHTSIYIYI